MENNKLNQSNEKNNASNLNQLENGDTYLKALMELFFENENISVAFLQKKLALGYSSAVRIIDTLESLGYISEMDTERKRVLLITKDEFENTFSNSTSH